VKQPEDMNDYEARAILKNARAWIAWDDQADKPEWVEGKYGGVAIDGQVDAAELRALLHFAPKDET